VVVGIGLLTLVPGRVGGSETYVRELLRGLAGAGHHEYRVFLPSPAPGVAAGLPTRVVASYPARRASSGRALAMLAATVAPGAVRGAFREEPLDAVHYPLTTVLPRLPLPTVVTVHDLYHHEPLPSLPRSEVAWRRVTWRRVLRRVQRVIAISEVVKQSLVERYEIDPDRIRVVHHGVDHSQFRPGTGPREPFLLYPAHNWANKNHDRLLGAFATLRRRHPGLRLVLTGRGHERRRAPDGVDVLGHVPQAELLRLYQTAAALVFPSLYEGFGQPPLEAMASGCAVAAAATGAIPEVCDGAARLFDPWSVESMVEAIEDVLARPEEFAARGLARAALFSWERCAREHEAAYSDLGAAEE
jgi:glycosyltransferase involved in cell wall biosynthesis